MSFRLRAVGGLCNRIQAVLAYRGTHGPLEVYWDEAVPHFNTVLEPLPGVTFVDHGASMDATDYGIPDAAPSDWRRGYADLRPKPDILARIFGIRAALVGEYLAIHVRRTDMTPLAAKIGIALPTDAEYVAWMEQWPDLPVFLATDNAETQARFLAAHPRMTAASALVGREHVRDDADHPVNGTLADAVVDLFVCAGATHWMGQGFGTFSGTIRTLRGLA
jgi:hypothetical protein